MTLSRDDFESLGIAYQYRDFCQDEFAEYLTCVRRSPKTVENTIVYYLPMSEYFTRCKTLKDQWNQCQVYREKELFEELQKIYDEQKKAASS